jgi:ATP-dependent Lon protease
MSVPTTAIPEEALADLPIFPLPQVVLFPHAMLPLHVFEPRYRAMLRDCMGTHRAMAVALIVDPHDKDEHGNPRIARMAGIGFVVEHQALQDGRSNILVRGRGRVVLEEAPFVPPYRRARATLVADVPGTIPAEDRTVLLATANAFTNDLRQRDPSFSFRLPQDLEPAILADLCAHHLIIEATVRQRILEELDPRERVRMVTTDLALQHSLLQREQGEAVN